MTLLLRNLRRPLAESEEDFLLRTKRRIEALGCPVRSIGVAHRSIDARARRPVAFVYSVAVQGDDESRLNQRWEGPVARFEEEDARDEVPAAGEEPVRGRVIVVGSGPAGLYAAYLLAEAGFAPLLCERGMALRDRVRAVRRFFADGTFSAAGTMVSGAGGAGTYSDGKLATRSGRPGVAGFYRLLVACGAPRDILVDAQPHVGTDRLRLVLLRLGERLAAAGCEVRYETPLAELRVRDGALVAARLGERWEETNALVLAAGQNSDGVYPMVAEGGGTVTVRPYQLGLRIEHSQAWVDRWRFGSSRGHPALPPAAYQVTARGVAEGPGGGVTSFCMCPGGEVVPVTPAEGRLSTNGMSRLARAGPFANSALITTLPPLETPAAQLAFRAQLEECLYRLGGGGWAAPAQRAADYLAGRVSATLPRTSYRRGLSSADLRDVLPGQATAALLRALASFERIAPGFAGPEALLIGGETRVSAPVRIERTEAGDAVGIRGLFPCGEGSGYASGITSSALDGRRAAFAAIARHRPPA